MKAKLPTIENLEDLQDPRSRSLLSKYNLSILELPDLEQRLHQRGKFTISPLTAEKSSIIKELVASTILSFEFTKRNRFLIPCNWSLFISPYDGQKSYLHSLHYERERSIESYERIGRKLLKYATGLERCDLQYYSRFFLQRLLKPLYTTIHSIKSFGQKKKKGTVNNKGT